jgi:predicted Zn-dependent protease
MKNWVIAGVALTALVGLAGQAPLAAKSKDQPTGPIAISAKDKQTGAQAHPQLLAEFGGLYDAPQAAYVIKVGQKIAVQSGLSNAQSDFTISLLNSSVNNAFAIPGGYVYVTRQLMGLMNNEAELASVLGHEVGHVAARHSKKRNSRATWGGLGTIAATVLGGVLGGGEGARLGQQLGGSIAQGLVLKFSRSQEYEADDLGISYLLSAGYDTMAASTMLASLAQQTTLDLKRAGKSEKSLPEWASTHPDPASRVVRAQQKATALGGTGRMNNSDAFIAAVDGMLYDDDPKQGIVDNQAFSHPDLRVYFSAPNGYALNNGADAVTMNGTGGQAMFRGGAGGAAYTGDLSAFVAAQFKDIGGTSVTLNYGELARSTINGLSVMSGTASTTVSSGQQVRVTVYGYEFSAKEAFAVVSITPLASPDPFPSLYQSVRRLTEAEAKAVRPRRIDVVTVKSSDTVEGLAARMAYSDYKAERFRVLNGLASTSTLKAGQKVKIIVFG